MTASCGEILETRETIDDVPVVKLTCACGKAATVLVTDWKNHAEYRQCALLAFRRIHDGFSDDV